MSVIQNLKNQTGDILIVDDSIVDLQLLTEMLRRKDFQVRPFENSQPAIDSALSRPPYLILLEAGMPKMDGFEVCQLLKQDERTRDIPIIFVSARTEGADRIKCYKAGGVDIISKPFQEPEVLARVRTHTKLHNMQLNLEKLVAKHLKEAEEKLQESEKRFSDVANNALDWMWEVDSNGKYTYVSPVVEKVLGYKPEEMLQKHFYDLLYPDDHKEKLKETAFKIFAKKKSFREFTHRNAHKNGKEVWLSTSGVPLLDETGELVGYRGIDRDISDRKLAERKLKSSEQQMSLVLDNTNEMIAYHDLGHIIQWANKAYLKATGLPLSELKKNKCYHAWGFNRSCKNCPVTKAMKTGEPQETELTPLNQEHWPVDQGNWLIRAAPVKDDSGSIIGAIEVAYDITERMQVQTALEQNRTSLAKAQEITHTGSWQLDVLKGELLWSDEIYRIFNVARDIPMTYNKFLRSIHPEDKVFVEESWMEAFNNEPHVIEYRIIAADRVKWVSEQIEVKFKKEGELLFAVGIIQEITERKEAEKELREIRSELLHSTRNRTLVELTAALAHELNHPLGSILNNANAARRYLSKKKPNIDEIRNIVDDIISEDRRATDVMQKVRALMKHSQIEFSPLNINTIIEEVLKLTQSDLIIKNISVSKRLGRNLPSLKGDPVQLQQVFLNLIINASDAMHESKMNKIHISTAKQGNEGVIVCVEDFGTGFDEKEKEKLFEPFFTTKKEGMGMGLSVVKTIVKAHGGDVWVENNEKKGASFFVRLNI